MDAPRPKLFTRTYIFLFATNFVFFLGFYMLAPTLPLYGAHLGGNSTQVGMVSTAFSIASVAVRFSATFLVERFGRKGLMSLGILLAMLLSLGYPLVHSIYSVMLLRIVQGLGFGLVTTYCAAMVADSLPDERRGEGIGYFGLGTSVAFAFSPAVGLAFVNHMGFPIMFVAAAIAFAGALAVFQFTRDPVAARAKKAAAGPAAPAVKPPWWNRFFDTSITWPFILLLLFGLGRGAEQNFIPLLAKTEDLSALSVFYIINTTMVFLLRFFTSRTYDKKGPLFSAILGGIMVAASMMTMSLVHGNLVLILAAIFSGMGIGLLVPTYQVWVITSVPPEKRTMGSALYYNTYDIGIAVGSVLYGAIAGRLGYHGMFRVCFYVTILYLILCLIVRAKGKHRPPAAEPPAEPSE